MPSMKPCRSEITLPICAGNVEVAEIRINGSSAAVVRSFYDPIANRTFAVITLPDNLTAEQVAILGFHDASTENTIQ
jgi:hypothetical protein